mgnify:CR=1 FL=1
MDKKNCGKPQFSGEWVKLGDAFELRMGKTPSRKNMAYWRNGKYDWVSIADLGAFDKYVAATKEQISDAAIVESRIKPAPANTVLMSFKLSIGKAAITRSPVFTNEAIMALVDRGKYRIDPTFIYHQCKAKDWTAGSNTAVMGKTLNKKTLSETRIYLPGFEKQIQIAAELDYLDEQIASANAVSERLDALVKSRFIEMFGNPNSKQCEAFIEDAFFIRDDLRKPLSGKERDAMKTGELYPYYGANGKVDDINQFLTDCDALCFAEDCGSYGPGEPTAYVIRGKAWVNNHAHLLVAKCSHFLEYARTYFTLLDINRFISGTTRAKMTQAQLKKVNIEVPDQAMLREFDGFVSNVDKLRFMLLVNPSPTYRGRSFCCSTNSGNGGVILEVKDY